MIREIRLFLYFIVGALLGAVSVFAHAETIPATVTNVAVQNGWAGAGSTSWGTASAACQSLMTSQGGTSYTVMVVGPPATCRIQHPQFGQFDMTAAAKEYCPSGTLNTTVTPHNCGTTVTCPANQGWTLSGQTCTRSECPSYITRDPVTGMCTCPAGKTDTGSACVTSCPTGYHNRVPDNGQCEQDCIGRQIQATDGTCKCTAGQKNSYSYSYGDGSAGNCSDGCAVQTGSVSFCPGGLLAAAGVKAAASVTCYTYGTTTGSTCGANSPLSPNKTPVTLTPTVPSDTSGTGADGATKDPKNTPDNNKDPVACGDAGGTYLSVNGVGKCATATADNAMDKLTTKKSTSVTTNPDGTKTETTETTSSTQNPKTGETVTTKSSTTTTKDAAGNVTGVGTSTGTSSGNGTGGGDSQGQCSKEPNSPLCKEGKVTGEKGTFGNRDQEIEAAKTELRGVFNSVSAEIKGLFSNFSAGSGALPCPPSITVLGHQFRVCSSDYSSQLDIIGTAIYLVAALAAAFIIFRS